MSRLFLLASLLFQSSRVAPVFADDCASSDPAYAYVLSPISGLDFYWTLDSDSLSVKLVYSKGEAWLGVGPSKDGRMVGSEVVVGIPAAGTVKKYDLNAQSLGGVDAMSDAKQATLTGTSITAADGATEMTFVKPLTEAGELDWGDDSSSTILIFAVGVCLGFVASWRADSRAAADGPS